jgi:hypothetical protein
MWKSQRPGAHTGSIRSPRDGDPELTAGKVTDAQLAVDHALRGPGVPFPVRLDPGGRCFDLVEVALGEVGQWVQVEAEVVGRRIRVRVGDGAVTEAQDQAGAFDSNGMVGFDAVGRGGGRARRVELCPLRGKEP